MNGYKYRAIFNNSVNASATTTDAILTVQNTSVALSSPNIIAQPASQVVVIGGKVNFTAAVNGYPISTVQWQVNAGNGYSNLIGNNTNTLTLTNVTLAMNGYQYRAIFTNSSGTITTTDAMLTVQSDQIATTLPTITLNPINQTVQTVAIVGGKTSFTAVASGYPNPTVQWWQSTNGGLTYSKLIESVMYSGTTTNTLIVNKIIASQNGYRFRAVFTNAAGTTAAAVLTIQTTPITAVLPSITANPINQTIVPGDIISFTAIANGYPVPNVQWQVNTGSGYSNLTDNSGYSTSPENIGTLIPGCIYSGSGTNTLTIARTDLSQNGYLYRAVFTNDSGSAATSAATLTVQTNPITNIGTTISVHPTSKTVQPYNYSTIRTDGSKRFVSIVTASFTAIANGYPVSAAQWQVSTDGGVTYVNIVENGTQMMWAKYIGDPSSISIYSPVANLCADEYFKKFTNAGLKVGVCLRPTLCRRNIVANGNHGLGQHEDYTRSVIDILSEKVDYAFNRWGCTLFYVDSNSVSHLRSNGTAFSQVMSAEDWDTLAKKYPNMLFIPEHSYYRCYTSSAAYDQMDNLPGGYAGITPLIVKKT